MKIKWLGTASILIKSGRNKILFDPYLKNFNKNAAPFPLNEVKDVKAIFITHPHFDHFSDLPALMRATDCPVYVNERGVEIAKKQRFYNGRFIEIKAGENVPFENISVRSYRGRHVRFDGKLRLSALKRILSTDFMRGAEIGALSFKYRIKPCDVLCYGVKARKKTLFIMGSAGISPKREIPRKIDLLIYPYQGRSDMRQYSEALLKLYNSNTIFLDHYDDAFPPVSARMDAEGFSAAMQSTGKKVIVPEINEWFSFPS